MSSVAPALSQALAAPSGADWTEICSATGSKLVSLVGLSGEKKPSPPGKHLLEHCPYCALQVTAAYPPPAALAPVLLPLAFEAPRLYFSAPRTLYAWRSSQPRGPPLFA